MPDYIDTHAHLYLPEFDADRENAVETAVYRGVNRILLPNIDSATIDPMNRLAETISGDMLPDDGTSSHIGKGKLPGGTGPR